MNESLEISLVIPIELGADVISKPKVVAQLNDTPGVTVVSSSNHNSSSGAYRDVGGTAVVLLGTAVAVAAVRGLFDLLKTVIHEAYETRRSRDMQQHEMRILLLRVAGVEHLLDLNLSIETIDSELARLLDELIDGE
jgi:hypothetical protein